MAFEAGQVVGGKYQLFKPLASGGMGTIWVARHNELDVSVAIKLISSEVLLSETAVARFRQEARAAAQLRSPHVVQILDYGVEQGVPYMAMELLSGQDLDERIRAQGRIPLGELVPMAVQVGKALKLAHAARIVHRDLKPANIYLARVGDDEIVKVLDFGIAKALSPDGGNLIQSTALVGSPLYMSPEQSRGDTLDPRTDLWSLGVVLYEALLGAPPFSGHGIGELFHEICKQPVPPPSERGLSAPGLDAFFARALAKDRDARFETIGEMIAALEACGAPQASAEAAPRAVSPHAETAEVPVSVAPARSLHAPTHGGISAEVLAPQPAAPRGPRRWPFLVAALGLGLAGLGWLGLRSFEGDTVSVSIGPRPEGAASQEPSAPTAPAPRKPEVEPSSRVAAPPSAPVTASSNPTAVATAAVATASPGAVGPRPTARPVPTATAKVATPDPVFGISPQP